MLGIAPRSVSPVIGFRRAAPSAVRVLLLLASGSAAAACSDSREPATIGAADAFTAIIRWEIDQNPPPPKDGGSVELPVIYVTATLGDSIDATTQATVAEATKDEAVVRFADRREDVVEMDDPKEPVKDENIMLLVGPLPEPSRAFDVQVVRYRSLDDQRSHTLSLVSTRDGARVTSATEAAG